MTVKQVQYFLAVYRHGNITKAADELHVSRTVISRALSDIEQSLETRLFDRTSSGIAPTEHGKILYNMFDGFVKSYRQTVEKLKAPGSADEKQDLRIGILDASSGWFYPTIYRPFHEKYPNVMVNVEGIEAEEAAGLILEGELDMAIAPSMKNTGPETLLESLYLYTTQWVLCAPKGSALPKAMELTAVGSSKLSMAVLETLPGPFYDYKDIVLTTKDPNMVRFAVTNGYAHAVLPMEICADWDDVYIMPFVPPETPDIYLFWNGVTPHGASFDRFVEFVRGVDFEFLRKSWGGYKAGVE